MPLPFVLVADFAGIAAALFCTLLAIAVVYLLRALAAAIGKIGIGPFSLDLGGIVSGALNDAADWIVGNTKALWIHVATLLQATAYIFDHLFNAAVNAITHAFDYVDHVVTVTIPQAVHTGLVDARRYADNLKTGIENDIGAAASKVEGILEGDVRTIDSTISTDIATVEGDITRAVTRGVSTAENYADDAIHELRRYVDSSISTAEAIAARALTDAKTQIGQAIASVAATAHSDLIGVESTLEQQLAAAANTAAAGIASAERAATAEVGALEAQLEATVSSDVGALTNDIASAEQALEGDLSNLKDVLSAAIAASIAGVVARVAKLEQCSVGVCEDSPNNFGNLLSDALGLASLAGVGVFLAEAINDPAQAVSTYSGEINDARKLGQGAFETLLSL